jgi:hypothetical protein
MNPDTVLTGSGSVIRGRIRIRSKSVRIRNTAYKLKEIIRFSSSIDGLLQGISKPFEKLGSITVPHLLLGGKQKQKRLDIEA